MRAIIEKIIALLQQLLNEVDEPKRPSQSTEMPKIESIDTGLKTRGKYKTPTGAPRGVVIHFTAGRFASGKTDAINTLKDLSNRGLGCFVMDTDGVLYKDKNQSLSDVGYHAGDSRWMGKKSISYHCMGLEICCGGNLDSKGRTWYGLDIPRDQRRTISNTSHAPIGTYHKFTKAQEKAIMNFIKWQMDTNPEFDADWIVGHHEISPGRKSDPGGSLSISMRHLREKVKMGDFSI